MKTIFSILGIFLFSLLLHAQTPKVSIYIGDGTKKSYNISDIDNLNFITGKNTCLLKIYYQHDLTENFQTNNIESIKFNKDNKNYEILEVYVAGKATSYKLADIDSINFFTPQVPVPYISSITPSSGQIGELVSVKGINFGKTQGTSILAFKGANASTFINWSDTMIIVKVPKGAISGKLSVTVNDIKSNEIEFDIFTIPILTSISPTSGRIGELLTLKGTGFGGTQGSNSVKFIDNPAVDYLAWNDTIIKVTVPKNTKTGNVSVSSGAFKSNEIKFTILSSIDSIYPSAGRVGDTITITGYALGSKRDSNLINFNGASAKDYIKWTDTLVKVKIPVAAKTGKISAMINKVKTNELDIAIIPVITSIAPDTAGVTQKIVIYGNGFGAVQGTGKVSFNGADGIDFVYWSDFEISVAVPEGTKSGKVIITASGYTSNAYDFTICANISGITPAFAKTSEQISILGTNFGSTQGTSTISFYRATVAKYVSWSDTEIKLIVPDAGNSGKIYVTVNNIKSNEYGFTVVPNITSISPNSEKIGSNVTIAGTGFGEAKGTGFVSFTGADATEYASWGINSIAVKVPAGARNGKVSVTASGQKSNELDFTLLPSISSIYPNSGLVGDEITITGVSFGSSRGTNTVSFNGTTVIDYVSWTDSEIRVKVPPGTTTGKLSVIIGGVKSNEIDFYLKPQLTFITPDVTDIGNQVTISGINLGSSKGTSILMFTGFDATNITLWNNTTIILNVPDNATTGTISVTVNGILSNELNFTATSIMIGTQNWKLRNLEVTTYRNGDAIPQCSDQSTWATLTTGAWCYYADNSGNGTIYGKLYNWYAVNDARGLAPSGWHIPTDAEWSTLTSYLGGEGVAGGKLKETGTSHWTSPNTGADNTSGFTALGGGYRVDAGYNRLNDAGVFWSATQQDIDNAIPRTLFYNSAGVTKPGNSKRMGMSVRILKD